MSLKAMSLKTWLGSLLGERRHHIVMMLALALTVNVWSLSPAASHGVFSTGNLDLAADTAAIVAIAEPLETAKGQIDGGDDSPFAIVHPVARGSDASLSDKDTSVVTRPDDHSVLPHKTGPPTRA